MRARLAFLVLALTGCGRGGFYALFAGPDAGAPDAGPHADSGPSCPGHQLFCEGGCVDPSTDNGNCGSCGNACSAGISACIIGTCQCLEQVCPGLPCGDKSCFDGGCGFCGAGFTRCPLPDGGCGYCADTTSDKSNCGACGIACGPNQKCSPQGSMSVCVCDTTAVGGADLIPCSSGCVHDSSDPSNCGGCGILCTGGQSCVNSQCACPTAGCMLCNVDAGLFACGDPTCTDVTADVHNCGSCRNDCTLGGTLSLPGIECFQGQCLCQHGQAYICPAAIMPFPTLACIDTASDPLNCGGCGLLADGGGPYADGGLPPSPHICGGVKSACENGSCFCPNNELYCAPGTWNPDAGSVPNDGGICLNDTFDPLNCGGCGNNCATLYAATADCAFASCGCFDGGICVGATDPSNPSCYCPWSISPADLTCSTGASVTFLKDIYPMLSATTVTSQPSWGSGAVLVGCAVTGCHDATAAAGLQFTDPDASYQELTSAISTQICNGVSTQILNPSQICFCQSLVLSGDGAHSLLFTLLDNSYLCPNPDGGVANPMPIDDGGTYHPLSACLAAQVRQWIDQGAVY